MTEAVIVKGIDPATSKTWIDEGKAVLIDVREIPEYDAENIPGATLVPLSQFDPNRLPPEKEKIAIYHCRSGRRTADYFGLFQNTGYADVFHMEGGIIAWREAGLPTRAGG